jgi:hypothetical protein
MDTRRRLYHARINSHLTLEQIGVRTALSPSVLRNIDEGKFELLPSGVYARSYVRTFAAAVGLDPEATLADVEHMLPGAPDPVPALNALRPDPAEWAGQLVMQLLRAIAATITACISFVRVRFESVRVRARNVYARLAGVVAPRIAALSGVDLRSRFDDVLRRADPWRQSWKSALEAGARRVRALNSNDLTARLVARAAALDVEVLTRRSRESVRGILLPSVERLQASPHLTRCGAAAIDALLLLLVDSFLVVLVSWSSGIGLEQLMTEAGWALGSFCAIPIALYFLLFGGIAGSTLGGYVCSLLAPHRDAAANGRPHHPLTLHEILRRAVRQ